MGFDNRPYHQLFLADPDWYEPLERYQPSPEVLLVVRSVVPLEWPSKRSNVWFNVRPPGVELPDQGWKIHVSAKPGNCVAVARAAAEVCVAKDAAFKVAMDSHLVYLSTCKAWRREASGKFITIYPANERRFHDLLETLYGALQGFSGPYILSDRRYRDSRVVYYRYGGINDQRVLTLRGDVDHVLTSPSGDLFPDIRAPYWSPPPWVSDPYASDDHEASEPVLKDGRYRVERALGFAVTGGAYLASDGTANVPVVLKEARPDTGVEGNGIDAIERLKKEYRLLCKLSQTGITPAPIDMFWEWEHLFLVEEYVPGPHLGLLAIASSPLVTNDLGPVNVQQYIDSIKRIWSSLANGIATMHECGIVCGDLSLTNVMVRDVDRGDVRIVDLEAAWEEGVDAPVGIMTPGFGSAKQPASSGSRDDVYALGSIMLGTLFPINNVFAVEPDLRTAFSGEFLEDLGLPEELRSLILACMSDTAGERPSAREVERSLAQMRLISSPRSRREPRRRNSDLQTVLNDITSYIKASADPLREDRLFPADPIVYSTNPLSISHGACGVAYALLRTEGEIPSPLAAWILSRPITADLYPPGLYLGLSGIAWVLYDLGFDELAVKAMCLARDHPLLWREAGVYYGAAGYGMACLHFFVNTGDQGWLDCAFHVGEWLTRTRNVDERGWSWAGDDGQTRLGYAHGASGIALFLSYLGLACKDDRLHAASELAVDFDLSQARPLQYGGLSVPRGRVGALETVVSPYWLDGSAGVGTALVRISSISENPKYAEALRLIARDASRKYTAFPGLLRGLSGLGNFLLDGYAFTGEGDFLVAAQRAASGLLPFAIRRDRGVAFPGEQLLRISTDYATGSSGVALFLHRLLHVGDRAADFNFTLDALFHGRSSPNPTRSRE
ncbi:MAG: class III lanthionine synthetase LanKC [Chloroflexota bacterium]